MDPPQARPAASASSTPTPTSPSTALALVSLVEFAADSRTSGAWPKRCSTRSCSRSPRNSWRGMHGAAHGRSYTPTLRSAPLRGDRPDHVAPVGHGRAQRRRRCRRRRSRPAGTTRCPRRSARSPGTCPRSGTARQIYRGEYRLRARPARRAATAPTYASGATPDAMLSSVQDYRVRAARTPGAHLGRHAPGSIQVFATNPAADNHRFAHPAERLGRPPGPAPSPSARSDRHRPPPW